MCLSKEVAVWLRAEQGSVSIVPVQAYKCLD